MSNGQTRECILLSITYNSTSFPTIPCPSWPHNELRMIINNSLPALLLAITLLGSCETPATKNINTQRIEALTSSDSTELTALIRNVYEWHLTQHKKNGFPFKITGTKKDLIAGIDWDAYENEMQELRKTQYFSDYFFAAYQTIAHSIDSSIQQSDKKWRDANDGMSIWETGADDWCNCQDYPDDYWKLLTLNNFSTEKDEITFYWTWGDETVRQYQMKARKENGNWKISYIQGFKSYTSVAGYQQIINDLKEK